MTSIKHFLFFFLSFFSFLLMTSGCQKQNTVSSFKGNAMTIDYKIIVGEKLPLERKKEVELLIKSVFSEINEVYNKWNPHSELSRLNQLKANEIAQISPELERFLLLTQEIVEISEGRFDPTIGSLQQLWVSRLTKGQIPTKEEIQHLTPSIGWNKIHFSNGLFYKDHDSTYLDLGGIAKGFCVDRLVESLNTAGYPNVFVEWGGEIRASGEHPDQRPWNIFISRLGDSNPENAIEILSLKDQAIATSGDYLQNWTVAKNEEKTEFVTYCHIIDPRSHCPLMATSSSIASASVLAPTCLLADGLATAMMLFPSPIEAKAWGESLKEKTPSISFWLVSTPPSPSN